MSRLHFLASAKPDTGNLMAARNAFWLVKSEPDCFSIQHLAAAPKQTTVGAACETTRPATSCATISSATACCYYHSSADPPAVAGTAVIVREAYPDNTAWDPKDDHFDPKASPENPIWQMVDIELDKIFPEPVPIGMLRESPALVRWSCCDAVPG